MNQFIGCPLLDDLIRRHPNQTLLEYARNAVRFRADNVAAYVEEHAGKLRIQDTILTVAPLADSCWFEFSYPDGISIGVLIVVLADTTVAPLEALDAGDRWLVGCWLTVGSTASGRTRIGHIPVGLALSVKTDGAPHQVWQIGLPPDLELSDYWQNAITTNEVTARISSPSGMMQHMAPALLAVCFSHCRNVTRTEVKPSRQVYRQAARTADPVVAYKILNIDPARKVLQDKGDIAHNGLQKALHIVRGHFARYTPEKPLFGRYVGMVYHPVHTRGSLDKGRVVKSYNVKALKSEAQP